MKRAVTFLVLSYLAANLLACSKQWREGTLAGEKTQLMASLTQATAQSSDSEAQQFLQIVNSGGSHLFYAEAVEGKTTAFGTGVKRVFPVSSWQNLGISASPETIKSVKAFFVERNAPEGAQYGLLLDVDTTGGRQVKTFIAQSASIDNGQISLGMSGGLVLTSNDIVNNDSFATVIQLQIYDQQSQLIGKVTTLIGL